MSSLDRISYTRTINYECESNDEVKTLQLMMISCEDSAPYGPSSNTANMFLDLLEKAYRSCQYPSERTVTVSITVYEAKQRDYPASEQEWNSYDGIILPGSFSSAYETDDWIEELKTIIQNELHLKQRKTMAVCFGHQVFAHSFGDFGTGNDGVDSKASGGLVVPCPASIQVGHRHFECSTEYFTRDQANSLNILYTHGDMVHSLPSCAIVLGGTETVPIQAAVYLTEDKKPYVYSFQGHPEFACELGIETFNNILDSMQENKKVPREDLDCARSEALREFKNVEEDSVHLMQVVGRSFGWM
jgi:GMP synthase-like glutamine amidotransferase